MRPVLAAAVLTAVLLLLQGSSPAQATRSPWNGDAESELDYQTEGEFFPAEEEEPTFRRHRHGKKRADDGNDEEDEEEHLAVGGVEDIGTEPQAHKHHHHKDKARPASAESREMAWGDGGEEAAWNGDASTTTDYEEEWAGRKKGRHAGRKGKKGGKKGRKKGKGHRNNKKNQIPVPPGGEPEIVTFDDIMGPAEDAESRPSVLPPVVSKAPPGGDAVATKLPDVRPTETLGQDVKKGRGGRGRGKGRDPPRLNGAQDVPTSDLEDFLGMRLPHNTTDVSCELHDDCFEGECCNANKGKCVAYKQEQGQRCKDSCMCRKGLRCFVRKAKKMVKTGKIRGQCMNPDDPDLPKGGAFLPDI
ncbi:PREDICTED: draxin-B-like [Branchiostoma belcheri]|uniref:Draxin-B-like n=1 Tax=Branchiostoma belcheri TaxID=7741 RepID=A0A6P5A7S1_BRABE|nr:PREDICTED: draxin-B-like [Branchiostoma belcheri]